ncbi:VOC family protein [Chloroflexota bacterium]
MPKYWFEHVHLISDDPQKTAEFYEKIFGARNLGTRNLADERIVVDLELNGVFILIMSPRNKQIVPGTAQTGLEHLGVRTDDLEAAVAELKAKGVNFVQDITQYGERTKLSFLLTPENTLVELLERSG